MTPQVVSITSQGQITIPAQYRRKLKLGITNKALVELKNQQIVINPLPDLLTLKGSLKTKRKITRVQERRQFLNYLANRKKNEKLSC